MAKPGDFAGTVAVPFVPSSHLNAVRPRTLLVYWHLLSLDAPTVAMLWTWFIAKTSGVRLPWASVFAMGVAVWVLYAADRLLDSHPTTHKEQLNGATAKNYSNNASDKGQPVILSRASRNASPTEAKSKDPDVFHAAGAATVSLQEIHFAQNTGCNLEPRHLFHRLHRRAFFMGIAVALLALVVLVPRLSGESLRLYTILGTLLGAYFTLIHKNHRLAARMPKEIAVGIFFSAATFISTVARNPALRAPLLPAAITFGLVCSLNCLFIYTWEHSAPFAEANFATRLALRFLSPLAGLAMLAGFTLSFRTTQWQLPCAVAMATSLLLLLHINKRHLDPTTLRAAADLCLLTPIAFAVTLK